MWERRVYISKPNVMEGRDWDYMKFKGKRRKESTECLKCFMKRRDNRRMVEGQIKQQNICQSCCLIYGMKRDFTLRDECVKK